LLTAAIGSLKGHYQEMARNAAEIGPGEFSIEAMVENHRRASGI